MPISVGADLWVPSQAEFGALAYDLMNCFFDVHNELGRFFDESVYKREVARRFGGIQLELPIEVTFREYKKKYFADMLVRRCCIFEVKAVESLTPRHFSQAYNYLLLTELPHGKLVNTRTALVQHEFVNAGLTLVQRRQFSVDDSHFTPLSDTDRSWSQWLCTAIADWGTGLDVELYQDALTERLGGEPLVIRDIPIVVVGQKIGEQKTRLCAPSVAFKITTLHDDLQAFEDHAWRFLLHTELDAIQWINVGRETLTLRTLLRGRTEC